MDHLSLRLGNLMQRGWSANQNMISGQTPSCSIQADSLRADIKQKGVDMRIGLDIAALALRDHVDIIALVTGDSDFVPAMKFARRKGVQIFMVPLKHGIYDEMIEHADLIIDIEPVGV